MKSPSYPLLTPIYWTISVRYWPPLYTWTFSRIVSFLSGMLTQIHEPKRCPLALSSKTPSVEFLSFLPTTTVPVVEFIVWEGSHLYACHFPPPDCELPKTGDISQASLYSQKTNEILVC